MDFCIEVTVHKVIVAFVQSPGFVFVLRKFLLSDCGWYLKIHALWLVSEDPRSVAFCGSILPGGVISD